MKEFKIKLINKKKAAYKTKSFLFEKPKNFTWIAGQYLVMTLDLTKEDKQGNQRWFTISASPTEDHLMITTRMREGSVFKDTLDSYEIGTEINIEAAEGGFVLPENKDKQIVFIAGGIGVTPFRSMIKYVSDKSLKYKVLLLNSNKTLQDIAFFEELKNIAKNNSNIEVVYTLTGENEDWKGEKGRIDEDMLKKYVSNLNNAIFYTAGHPFMVDSYRKLLPKMGIEKDSLVFENFGGYQVTYN